MSAGRPRMATAGFTLAEVLAAMSLFGAAALAITSLFIGVTRMSTVNERAATAIYLAEDELEDLRAVPYDLVVNRTASFLLEGVDYLVTTTVTPDTPVPSVKYVTVTLSWSGQDGGSHTFTVDTVHADSDA